MVSDFIRAAGIALAMFGTSTAQATTVTTTVLDFESLGGTARSSFASPLEVDGFRFFGNGILFDYSVFGSDETGFYPGSFALFANGEETHTISRVDAAPFNLISLQYAEFFDGLEGGTLTWTGIKAAGGSVTADLTTDGVFGFQTKTFTGFTDLSSVTFTTTSAVTGDPRATFFQYDNITFETATVVPLPAALPLTLAGLGVLGWIGRRRTA